MEAVWSPGLDSAPLSVVTMELKLGSLVTLLLLTIISGLAPLSLFRRQGSTVTSGPQRRSLSLISCFSGGVFLSTCLLDLMPSYLSSIAGALKGLNITLQFPLQEFILAMGFFLVLVMEQVAMGYKDQAGGSEETGTLLGSASLLHSGVGAPHVHVDVNAHSAVRMMALVLALALHSALEGVALGYQGARGRVMKTCLALLVHKSLIAFSLTLKLGQGRLHVRAMLACLLFYSLMCPLGMGLGMAWAGSTDPVQQLTRSVLEGLATGAFMYITFLEILPHELSAGYPQIDRVIVLLCGFSAIAAVLFIKI
uniref:Solute carrier family 39 (Zinc transporter), member 1 n=1 Tax=Xenopus tropicalis TaxID=8364 RepID=A9ULA8_XENTR|nr:solute carrier family 39 (zinc transporter), member 1 [Xenopus tropicalis]